MSSHLLMQQLTSFCYCIMKQLLNSAFRWYLELSRHHWFHLANGSIEGNLNDIWYKWWVNSSVRLSDKVGRNWSPSSSPSLCLDNISYVKCYKWHHNTITKWGRKKIIHHTCCRHRQILTRPYNLGSHIPYQWHLPDLEIILPFLGSQAGGKYFLWKHCHHI